MKKYLALFGCLLLVTAAHAAPAVTTYDVEILVFENRLPELEGGELWTHNGTKTTPIDVAGAIDVGGTVVLDSVLTNAASALSRDGSYRVLAHRRWRQTAEEKSASKLVRIRSADSQLDGTMRFYMSRFLHVELNLALLEQTAVVDQSAVLGLNYRLAEQRRVKTQEINYFDHPKLGALVQITPVGKQ